MIDIHSHVLPGVDDGSQSLEESLALLSIAAESGVHTLVATPHCNIPGEYENYVSEEMSARFERLDRARQRAGIHLRLCRGMEVFATDDLPRLLRENKIWTLNGTRYFLMEFAFDEDPGFCSWVLRQCKALDYWPVIAHPERYYFVQNDPDIAFDWCVEGFPLQLNKGSILGRFGPDPLRCSHQLLQHGLAACVASDAHSPRQRSTFMGEIQDYLMENFGTDYCRLLLEENPSRILSGRELLGYEPIPF